MITARKTLLAKCKADIRRGQAAFSLMAIGLRTVKEQELYKEEDYDQFSEWVAGEFDLSYLQTSRLLSAAEFIEASFPIGELRKENTVVGRLKEGQLRELEKLRDPSLSSKRMGRDIPLTREEKARLGRVEKKIEQAIAGNGIKKPVPLTAGLVRRIVAEETKGKQGPPEKPDLLLFIAQWTLDLNRDAVRFEKILEHSPSVTYLARRKKVAASFKAACVRFRKVLQLFERRL